MINDLQVSVSMENDARQAVDRRPIGAQTHSR